jgi:hypothetical protein
MEEDTVAKEQEEVHPAGLQEASCSCIQDPFASLPSELRPRPEPKKGGLRKLACPQCNQEYWTNRDTDVCIQCERSSIHR